MDPLDPNTNVRQRTLKHGLESFFAVTLYITPSHDNPKSKKSSFARAFDIGQDFEAIYFIKTSILLRKSQFKKDCIDHINAQLPGGTDMKTLLQDMRPLLYPDRTESSTGDEDIIETCEHFFWEITDIIDTHLHDDHGQRSSTEIHARKSSILPM